MEFAFLCFQCFQNLFSQSLAALAAVSPNLRYSKGCAHGFAAFLHISHLCIGVCYEMVQCYHNGNAVFLNIFNVLFQIHKALCQCIQIFIGQICLRHTAVIFQRTHSCNQNNRIGLQACLTALDIKEFFSTQICTEACLCYNIIRNFHCCFCCHNGVTAMCDICEGAAVNNCQCVFQCLHYVRLQCILQKNRHRAVCANHFCGYRLILIGVANDDSAQHFLQLLQIICQAEDCHDFGSNGNLECVLSGYTVYLAAQAGNHISQLSVVQVYTALPCNSSGVNVQLIALLNVVIHHGCQEVICCCDGVQIAGKVQVDILHGNHLCIAAAGSAALYAHAGPQGRLTQAGNRILAHLLQCLCQADGNGCFAFACGGRVHRCYQNQLCIGVIFDFVVIFAADFALVFAVAIYIFFGNPCFFSNLQDMLHVTFLRNL